MKHILITMFAMFCFAAAGVAGPAKKADAQTAAWRYEIESVSVGVQGSCVLKVWSYSKNPNVAEEQSKKNAIHGVIFKGIAAHDRIPGKNPLVSVDEEAQNQKFFDEFFATGGEYMKFVSLTNSGAVGGDDVFKVGKEYKIGVTVTVSYNALRSFLETHGIIKKLDAGF